MRTDTKRKNKAVGKKFVEALALEMQRLGIEEITINYGGSGDEGQVEDADYSMKKGMKAVSEAELIRVPTLKQGKADANYDHLYELGEPKFEKLGEVIDNFAYSFLEMMGYGQSWGDGDGCTGTITITASPAGAKVNHGWYVQETEESEESV